jgi:hypothetical protein
MTSDSDDLEEALRQNLKLRRELTAEVAKAKTATQRGGIASRLGWVLYWTCLTMAVAWAALFLWWAWVDPGVVDDIRGSPYLAIVVAAPSLVLSGLGRAFRYVLSAKP